MTTIEVIQGRNPVYTSATPPVNPADGQLWWDSASGALFVWYVEVDGSSSQWVETVTQSVPVTPTGTAYDFPETPLDDDIFAPPGGPAWQWDGTVWRAIPPDASGMSIIATGSITSRTFANRASDRINVMDFGATGDGSVTFLNSRYSTLAEAQAVYPFATDIATQTLDWAAVQAAVNLALSRAQGTVWFPSTRGVYFISDTIVCTAVGNCQLGFEGEASQTYIRQVSVDGVSRTLFDCRYLDADFHHNRLWFKNLYISGPLYQVGAVGPAALAFDIANRQETVWSCVSVLDYWEAIKLHRSWAPIIVDKCEFAAIKGKTIYADDSSWKGARVVNNTFYNCGINQSQPCLNIGPGSGAIVSGNDFSTNYCHIQINNMFGIAIIGNYMEASTLGNIEFVNTAGSSGAVTITGNDLETAGASVIKFVDGLNFSYNQMYDCVITYDSSAIRVTQTGNTKAGGGNDASLGEPVFASAAASFIHNGQIKAQSLLLTAGFASGASSTVTGTLTATTLVATSNITATNVTANVAFVARPTDTTMGYVDGIVGDAGNVGRFEWYKPGSPPVRIGYMGNGAGTATLALNLASVDFDVNGGNIRRNGVQVVSTRETGFAAMTGTTDKATAFATSTVTLPQLAGRVMALQAALTTHGLIGT